MTGHILPLFILAKEIKAPEKTESGLIIAPTIKQPTITAEAILTGGDSKHEEMKVKIGDKLLFSPNVIRKFIHPEDKQEYLLLHQKDLLLFW